MQFINYDLRLERLRNRIVLSSVFLSFLGLVLVYETSSVYAWSSFGDPMYFLKRQVVFVLAGIISMLLIRRVRLEKLRKNSRFLMGIGLVLLVSVLIFGTKAGGAKRWIRFLGMGFQPSEFVKVIYIFYLVDYSCRKERVMDNFFKGILPFLSVMAITCFLLFLEPDFGNVIFFGLIGFIVLLISRVKKRYLLWLAGVFCIAAALLILSSPYRRARIFSYLNPWQDSKGSGFQLVQSQIGVGSGGILGIGLGESRQKLFFLPAAHTDFIFSIIAEELGFLGSVFILGLYLFILFWGMKLLKEVYDPFRYYLGAVVLVTLILQALINISVVVGLLPTKGLPLPFISYGGSSVLVSFFLLGLFLNAVRT